MSATALLRPLAWVIALALLALPAAALLTGRLGAERWPVRRLVLHAEFERVSAAQIEGAVAEHLEAGFFAIDLAAVRRSLEGLPWVARAEVRKRWPDALEIRLEEHRAVARLGGGRLLSATGAVFSTPAAAEALDLPQLEGEPRDRPELLEFLRFAESLFGGAGSVRALGRRGHGGWHLTLADGFRIELGREQPRERLARFARLRPRLLRHPAGPFVAADLRYGHGFALRRAAVPSPESPEDA